jgi:hypothetical protein
MSAAKTVAGSQKAGRVPRLMLAILVLLAEPLVSQEPDAPGTPSGQMHHHQDSSPGRANFIK